MDLKATPKWAWPGSCDLNSKFWAPLITFERVEQTTSQCTFSTETEDGLLQRMEYKATPKWA